MALVRGLFALILGLAMAAGASAQVRPGQPLSAQARQIAEAVPDEGTELPEQHYFRSNEWRQDLLIPHLEGRGGALVGVGSDQNYTMAAMARADMMFLVDYDPKIPWIHSLKLAGVRSWRWASMMPITDSMNTSGGSRWMLFCSG